MTARLATLTEAIHGAMLNRADMDVTMEQHAEAAAKAVLDLCGPKPLVWQRNGNHWAGGLGYVVRKMSFKGWYVLTFRNQFDQYFDTLEEAKAAAEAHHIAAYWAQSKIGGE